MTKKRDYAYELRANGEQIMTGDAQSMGVIFGNFDGCNFMFDAGCTQTHQQWLAYMRSKLKSPLELNAALQLLSPEGEVLQESTIGHGAFQPWVDEVARQLGNCEIDGEAYRRYFDLGLTPADAVMQERHDAGVLEHMRGA